MKVLFAVHGYPPELVGGTENTVRAQAFGLLRRGVDVVVVSGSMDWSEGFRRSLVEDVDPVSGRTCRVHRIHRADLYFDHWQKSAHPKVSRAFREILAEERPDVVHVQHWLRLSRDLVATAARAGIPSVVTLHDLWTTCLVTFRVKPGTEQTCEDAVGFSPCVACAGEYPPRTPWVTMEAGAIAFAEHTSEVARELDLARAIVTPSLAQARTIERFLSREPGSLGATVIPTGRELELERRTPLAPPVETGRLLLGAWGHLTPIKGIDLVLEAVRGLPDPDRVTLHLAGGDVMPEYTARLRELASGLDVTFHGAYDVAELGTHPATDAHAMVSGSRAHESWGLVIEEAWCLGLPVLLPAAGAFAERVTDGVGGLLYEQGSAGSLTRLLERLLAEPELWPALSVSVPSRAEAAPSVDEVVSRLHAVYEGACAAGPPPPPDDPRMRDLVRDRALEAWDESLSRRNQAELGFE